VQPRHHAPFVFVGPWVAFSSLSTSNRRSLGGDLGDLWDYRTLNRPDKQRDLPIAGLCRHDRNDNCRLSVSRRSQPCRI
jgi:hypothetical protein